MMAAIRLKYPARFQAVLRAKAPIVGIPYEAGCFRIERQLLKGALACPRFDRAEICNGEGPLTLGLSGTVVGTFN